MKKLNILLFALGAVALSSCDTYLDKLPDDRAEVNTYEKANLLLATAYADVSPNYLMEISSDNITDNGKAYGATQSEDMAYRWQDVTTTENDDPRSVWNETYKAAATANQVLDALPKITDKDTKDLQAEALLCRAYNIFRLSNTAWPTTPRRPRNISDSPTPSRLACRWTPVERSKNSMPTSTPT